MDMEYVNKLKGMTKDDIGKIKVNEMPLLETIWNLIEYVKELEAKGEEKCKKNLN